MNDCPQPVCDNFGRRMSYLRVSVTDRCNFRCRYCRTDFNTALTHRDILRYEELESLIRAGVAMGIRKIRFTGGEPFVRKGFMEFLEHIRPLFPDISLHVTTNGTMPQDYVARLHRLRVSVNLSLDSINRNRFAEITGIDALPVVLANMRRMIDLGIPLKINAVALRGVNDGELPTFLRLTFDNPIQVRFIELMPIGSEFDQNRNLFIPAAELQNQAASVYTLLPIDSENTDRGPARVWRLRDARQTESAGTFGLISSVTHNACAVCNRIRLTADGGLRPCLFDGHEYRIKNILRHPKLGLPFVRTIWEKAFTRKPLGSVLLDKAIDSNTAVIERRMVSIGG